MINMVFILIKIITSKYLQAKLVTANLFTSNVIVFIIAFGLKLNDPLIYDVAFVYALINFVASLAFYRFLQKRGDLNDN